MNRRCPAAAAVFVKTPGHSPVKTRLAARLGRSAAEGLHLACAQAVAAVLRQCAPRLAGYFAVAETAAMGLWPGLEPISQGQGTLAARLEHVSRTLHARHGSVLLLGADAPQLDAAVLARALDWLDRRGSRIAVGPAEDGGFWLFGSNRPLPVGLWQRVPMGSHETCARLLQALQGLGGIATLPRLRDLDTAGDLAPVRAALHSMPQPLAEQRAVAVLLAELAAAAGSGHA